MDFLEVLTCGASVLLTLSLWSHRQHKQCCSAAGKSPSNCYLRLTNQMPVWRSASYSSEDISSPGETNQNAWRTEISASLPPCKRREALLPSSFPSCTHGLDVRFLFFSSLCCQVSQIIPVHVPTGLSPASCGVPRGTVPQSKSNAGSPIKAEPLKHSSHCVVWTHEPSYRSYLCFISQRNGHCTTYS